jgi:hypothetical protein
LGWQSEYEAHQVKKALHVKLQEDHKTKLAELAVTRTQLEKKRRKKKAYKREGEELTTQLKAANDTIATQVRDAFTHACTHSLMHSLTHSLTHALTHALTHSRTHALIHSRTHSRTHALKS